MHADQLNKAEHGETDRRHHGMLVPEPMFFLRRIVQIQRYCTCVRFGTRGGAASAVIALYLSFVLRATVWR